MYNLLHFIYKFIGHILCRLCLIYWRLRDRISPPNSDSVLFVSHPDDDTLFFHTYIKKYKPYVVLMTDGWSLRRMPCFFKAMKWYGVHCRAYDLDTRDTRINLLKDHVQEVLALKDFKNIATHNSTGEYGHMMHKQVHQAVLSCVKTSVLCPVKVSEIGNYPVSSEVFKEKEYIFKNIYTTETWVLDEDTEWVINEKLEETDK